MKKTVIPAALPAEVRADVGCSCRNADTVVKSYSVVEAEVKDAGAIDAPEPSAYVYHSE
jgi:hypothetical protein